MNIYYLIIFSLIFVTVYFLLKKKEHFSTIDYNYDYIKKNPVVKKLYDQCTKNGISKDFCTTQISSYLNEIDIKSLKSTKSIELSKLPLVENIISYITRLKNEANQCFKNYWKSLCRDIMNNEVNRIPHKNDIYRTELKNIMNRHIDSLRRKSY